MIYFKYNYMLLKISIGLNNISAYIHAYIII